jgi:transposase
MRGGDELQRGMFSYVTLEQRTPHDHPVRRIRVLVDRALERMDAEFAKEYVKKSGPPITPERLLRALLLMVH